MTIIGSETEQNLLKAFAGESQAKNRYQLFANQAKKEELIQIANIFEETAEHEQSHAKNFFKFLEGGNVEITAMYPAGTVGSTIENLRNAAKGENEEWTKLYTHFANVALKEGFKEVSTKFRMIAKVEEQHERRFLKLLDRLENNTMFKREVETEWKCIKCGFVHTGLKAMETCPACNHPRGYFMALDSGY